MIAGIKNNDALFNHFLDFFIERFTYESIELEGLTLKSAREREINNFKRIFKALVNSSNTIGEIDYSYAKEIVPLKIKKLIYQNQDVKIIDAPFSLFQKLPDDLANLMLNAIYDHKNFKINDMDIEFYARPHLKVNKFIINYNNKKVSEIDEKRYLDLPTYFVNDLKENKNKKVREINFVHYDDYSNQIKGFVAIYGKYNLFSIEDEIIETLPNELKSCIYYYKNLTLKDINLNKIKTLTKEDKNFIEENGHVKTEDAFMLNLDKLSPLVKENIMLNQIGKKEKLTRYDIRVIGKAVNCFKGIDDFRRIDVLTGANFEAAPKDSVVNQLDYLLNNYYNVLDTLSPYEKEAFLLINLMKIHPFEDGNKRMAKVIMNMNLVKSNTMPVIVYENQNKQFYKFIENNDVKGFAEFLETNAQIENTVSVGFLKTKIYDEENLLRMLI